MKLQIRLVVIADNEPEQVHEIASPQRTELKLETLGMTLTEGQTILREIQRVVVERQVAECLEPYQHCSACGQPQRGKGQHDLSMRTVFGKMAIPSPRIVYCECQPHETKKLQSLDAPAARAHDAGNVVSGDQMVGFDELWCDRGSITGGLADGLAAGTLPRFASMCSAWPNEWRRS